VVVLVHGLGVGQRYFDPLAVQLGGEVLRPELREPATIEELASRLERLLDVPAAVVANSMGCQIAVALAVSRPDLVRSLALVGPTVDSRAHSVVRHLWRLGVDARYEPPRMTAIALSDYASYGAVALARQARHALDDRIEERLPAVAVPSVVIRGAHDPICPADWAREAAALLPDAGLVTVAGAGHAVHFSHPREVAAVLRGLPGMPAPPG
jgi:pimeloyl-ACP methyl ester carboxylesterase